MCDNFTRELSKVIVAQICKETGFQSIQECALETLCDVLQKYMEEIGYRSHWKSELACRTESNFHDARAVLKEMGVSLDDLYTFAALSDEIPFAKPVPAFPMRKTTPQTKQTEAKEQTTTSQHNGKETDSSLPPHIPKFLPPLPEPHTYVHTPVYDERVSDARVIKKRKSKEKRQVETSLAKLNEKLGNKPIINYDTARKTKVTNPYLNPPKVRKTETKDNATTAVKVAPTPVTQPLKKEHNSSKHQERAQEDDTKRVFTDLNEESERAKKRQRAEQILSLQYEQDLVDHELPNSKVPGESTPINSGPIVEKL